MKIEELRTRLETLAPGTTDITLLMLAEELLKEIDGKGLCIDHLKSALVDAEKRAKGWEASAKSKQKTIARLQNTEHKT